MIVAPAAATSSGWSALTVALVPDRHELRRLDHAVGQLEAAQAGARGPVRGRRDEDLEAGGAGHGQRAGRSSQRAGISGSARRGAGIS